MASISRASTSYTSATRSYPSNLLHTSTTPRPDTSMSGATIARPKTRPRTATSTIGGGDQQIICAVSESRGLSPIVGLAFVNLSTTEAVLCQISDTQTYVQTVHKLTIFQPTEILCMNTAAQPPSKLFSIVNEEFRDHIRVTTIDRKYWAENTGLEYIQHLAFRQDVEAIKVSLEGNYYATCCFAAVLKYVELMLSVSFPFHSLRIKYEPSEGAMMIDLSTIRSLELIQNLQNARSKDCLYGLLNQTLTPMGARLLKSNLLQPSTDSDCLELRYDALSELEQKEDVFFAVRQALKAFVDIDRVLTAITIIPTKLSIQHAEQSINNVILLKQFIKSISSIYEALSGTTSGLIREIWERCSPDKYFDTEALIDDTINEDITYQSQPLDLRNQRTYAVKAGVNGLLDVARQTYKEANADAFQLVTDLGREFRIAISALRSLTPIKETHELALEMKYDTARQYYIRIDASELEERSLPEVFINVFRKKNIIECQTLDLLKWNQKIIDSHHEVLQMSDRGIQQLIDQIRQNMAPLFKISDAIALLDMIASFAQLVTTQDYSRPELTQALAVKNGRHPIREKIYSEKYVPNDAYATQQNRFQIITGCNMSGKSTYIRSLALMAVMAQIGSFVPASYASFPIFHQLFARVSMDDCIEANVSTFAAEMRETAFILRNIDKRSMVIIDELGRGTSTRDGLSIAIAVAEALVDSQAFVWFATHFRDLPKILAERNGVVNLHLSVDMGEADRMTMLYKVASGAVREEHYGIALARVVGLPSDVIRIAQEVSDRLTSNMEKRKKHSRTILLARRRKLILSLREQLVQAQEGKMQGKVLATWMKKLQDEFVNRMAALDADVAAAAEESEDEQDKGPTAPSTSSRPSSQGEPTRNTQWRSEQRYEMTGALQSETGEEG